LETFEAHPAAKLFPMMSGDAFEKLVEDIKENGLVEPVVVHEGLLLDGRNRAAACEQSGAEVRTVPWDGRGGSPVHFVISQNLHRRHLTTSQRAAIALELLPMLEEEASARKRATQFQHGEPPKPVPADLPEPRHRDAESREQAGALLSVSGRTIQKAKRVAEKAPELIEEVRAGSLTVDAADRQVRQAEPAREPKTRQRKFGPADLKRVQESVEVVHHLSNQPLSRLPYAELKQQVAELREFLQQFN